MVCHPRAPRRRHRQRPALPLLLLPQPFSPPFSVQFFFLEFPQTLPLLAPIAPILQLYTTVPFASVASFFAIYLGIVQNRRLDRFVRFNGQQAILLDILLILPSLVESLFRAPQGGVGLSIFVSAYNSIWIYVVACVAVGVGSCLAGRTVLLPLVGEGADQQVM